MRLYSLVTMPLRAAMLLGTLAVMVAGGAGGVFLWRSSGPERGSGDRDSDRAAIRAACDAAARKVAEMRGQPARVGVLRVANDPDDAGKAALVDAFEALPGWGAQAENVLGSLAGDLATAVATSASLDELLSANERLDLQVVATGRILEQVTTQDGDHRAVLSLQAFDIETKQWLVRDNFSGVHNPPGGPLKRWPVWLRLLTWVVVVVVLPWVSAPATFWAVEQKRNSASLMVVAAYVAVDMLVAWALTGFARSGGIGWRLTLAFIVSALYTYVACEAVAARAR